MTASVAGSNGNLVQTNNGYYDALTEELVGRITEYLTPRDAVQLGLSAKFMGLKGMREPNADCVDIVHHYRGEFSKEILREALNLDDRPLLPSVEANPLHVEHQLMQPINPVTRETLTQGRLYRASFSADGEAIATLGRGGLHLWRTNDQGARVSSLLPGNWTSVNFSPNSADRLVTSDRQGNLSFWNRGANGEWGSTELVNGLTDGGGNTIPLVDAILSSDDAQVITAGADGSIRLWSEGEDGNWSDHVVRQGDNPIRFDSSIRLMRYNPMTEDIFVVGHNGDLVVYNRDNIDAEGVTLEGHTSWITTADMTQDGRVLVTGSDDRTARVWTKDESGNWSSQVLDPTIGFTDAELAEPFLLRAVACRPDGKEVVTGSVNGILTVWNKNDETGEWTGTRIRDDRDRVGHRHIPSVNYRPDGKEFVSTHQSRDSLVWSKLDEGSDWVSIEITGSTGDRIGFSAYHPVGSELLTAGDQGDASVWGR